MPARIKIHLVRLSRQYVRRQIGPLAKNVKFVRLKEANIIISTVADSGTCTFINRRCPIILVGGKNSEFAEAETPFVPENKQYPVPALICTAESLAQTIRHVRRSSR